MLQQQDKAMKVQDPVEKREDDGDSCKTVPLCWNIIMLQKEKQ